MRILIITSGLYEYFYSIQTELLLLGHEVYVLHYEPIYLKSSKTFKKEPLIGSDYDLVITANIFNDKKVLDALSLLNNDSPIISITLGHPVEEVEKLWQNYGVKQTNSVIKEHKILFWSPCKKATKEYLALGFESIVYAHFGFSERVLTFPFFCWKKPEDANTNVYLDNKEFYSLPSNIETTNTKIIYLGILPAKPQNLKPEIDLLARSLAEVSIADPKISRADMKPMWSYIFSQPATEQPRKFFTIAETFRYYHAIGTRRVFVSRLKKEFGEQFLLYGDDWIADKLDAEPTQTIHSRGGLYHNIPISIDFGSTSFETSFFPRPIEIVKNLGCLLSYRRYDSEHFFQENVKSCVFDTADDMCEKVDMLLNNEQERNICRKNIYNTFSKKHMLANSLKTVIDQAINLYF
ncbi:MAG: glycosyltransferase family 1 protein [Magnetococcales bacterium]|nr:glycosyltransferase family 1 protein [Magnetococcales bacterium]